MLHVCDKLGNLYTKDYDLFVFVLFDLHDGSSSHTVAQSTHSCHLVILVQRRDAMASCLAWRSWGSGETKELAACSAILTQKLYQCH